MDRKRRIRVPGTRSLLGNPWWPQWEPQWRQPWGPHGASVGGCMEFGFGFPSKRRIRVPGPRSLLGGPWWPQWGSQWVPSWGPPGPSVGGRIVVVIEWWLYNDACEVPLHNTFTWYSNCSSPQDFSLLVYSLDMAARRKSSPVGRRSCETHKILNRVVHRTQDCKERAEVALD